MCLNCADFNTILAFKKLKMVRIMIITVRIIMIMIVAREILRIIMMIIIKFINHDNNNNNCHYDDGSDINKRERKEIIVYMTDLYNL